LDFVPFWSKIHKFSFVDFRVKKAKFWRGFFEEKRGDLKENWFLFPNASAVVKEF